MNRLMYQLRWFASGLGRHGVIGVGLLVFSVAFYFSSLMPARIQLAGLKDRAASLQLAGDAAGAVRKTNDPVSRIKAFYRTFPGAENLAPAINETYIIAGRHGLTVEQADYQYRIESDDDLAAYEMAFSVKGPYPKVRNFLLDVLRMHPGVAVDSLNFRRESATTYGVETKLRLIFFVRSRPWEFVPQDAG